VSDPGKPAVTRTIDISTGFQAWQARCLECGWAYLVIISDASVGEERPPFRCCAVCGRAAAYFRLDPL
jgi:hypothetical protein